MRKKELHEVIMKYFQNSPSLSLLITQTNIQCKQRSLSCKPIVEAQIKWKLKFLSTRTLYSSYVFLLKCILRN